MLMMLGGSARMDRYVKVCKDITGFIDNKREYEEGSTIDDECFAESFRVMCLKNMKDLFPCPGTWIL